MNQSGAKVIAIMGPTASGKTALAMALYDELDVELISVDSALVYRQMNIGSAKPSVEELQRYPHHLIDICDPANPYSAADFKNDATKLIEEIHQRNKIPILVGGTMLYYKALLQGINELPAADPTIREKLLAQANKQGWQAMHQRLQKIDAVAAERIHPNDPQRIQRALEIFEISGKNMTEWQQQPIQLPHQWQVISIAVAPREREILRARIAERFELMLENGFEKEVKALMQRGDLNEDLPAVRAVGYRQMWQYLNNQIDYEEMKFRGIIATRQLAKRQMTWLRSWPELNWLHPEDYAQQKDLTAKAVALINH
jgi:tRNA dimethylallyltransferase